jgi:Na+/proline symporter
MDAKESVLLSFLGLTIWILGTVYYAYVGPNVLETTELRYWASFAASPVLSAAVCVAILRWRRVSPPNWAAAMLLLAIPGMIGEAIVLSHLGTFMPKLHATSGGKYGAFLFATYAVVLGLAEVVTLRATP